MRSSPFRSLNMPQAFSILDPAHHRATNAALGLFTRHLRAMTSEASREASLSEHPDTRLRVTQRWRKQS